MDYGEVQSILLDLQTDDSRNALHEQLLAFYNYSDSMSEGMSSDGKNALNFGVLLAMKGIQSFGSLKKVTLFIREELIRRLSRDYYEKYSRHPVLGSRFRLACDTAEVDSAGVSKIYVIQVAAGIARALVFGENFSPSGIAEECPEDLIIEFHKYIKDSIAGFFQDTKDQIHLGIYLAMRGVLSYASFDVLTLLEREGFIGSAFANAYTSLLRESGYEARCEDLMNRSPQNAFNLFEAFKMHIALGMPISSQDKLDLLNAHFAISTGMDF